MPLYEFVCAKCGHEFEELTNADTTPKCPRCHAGETQKLLSTCARRPRPGGDPGTIGGGGGCGSCSGGNCGSCGH